MDAKNAVLRLVVHDNCTERHPLEEVIHLLEHTAWVVDVLIESLSALLAEAQVSVHTPVLMIASQKEDLAWVFELESE